MNGIKGILIIGLVLVACGQAPEPLMPLSKDTPNTVTLSTGEVVYKLNGQWDLIFAPDLFDEQSDTVTITQTGKFFIGKYNTGTQYLAAGADTIKGELVKNGFKAVYVNTSHGGWRPATGKISKGCNTITAHTKVQGNNINLTLTRKAL